MTNREINELVEQMQCENEKICIGCITLFIIIAVIIAWRYLC